MVHSGAASPMKTTPSASPHLTVAAKAAPPLVPPSEDATDQDLTQTNLFTPDLASNSDLTQPFTSTPADPAPPVVTPAKAVTSNSSPASAWSSPQTPSTTQNPLLNGRTSGRKRTPKACDCCGPNSKGHNTQTSGRGKARGRGRGREMSRDLRDTTKRKVDGQLTGLKCFDLTKEAAEEAEDEGDTYEKVQRTELVADIKSQTPVARPVTVSLQDGPITSYVAPEKRETLKKEDMLIEGSGGRGGGNSRTVEKILLGMAGRAAPVVRGRGRVGAVASMSASKTEVEVETKRGCVGGVVISSKSDSLAPLVFVQRPRQKKDAEMDHGEKTDPSSVKSPLVNGDTVNLSDTEPEEEAKEGNMIKCEMTNGLMSVSQQLGLASRSGSPQDLDSGMQLDKTPDRTDSMSVPVTMSNGNVPIPTNHCSALMEVETSHPALVAPPFQGFITVCRLQHSWALRDHGLYCHPGTWEREGVEEVRGKEQSELTNGQEVDGEQQNKESLEQLTDMIHEFLESFYMKYGSFVPLSETDVLEYLKTKGNSDLSNRGLDIKREMNRYRAGLASAPIAGFMVSYNKHTLGLEDLSTLEEQNWLNDQIINMYGELIMEATQHKVHFFNSFFHKQLVAKGYDGVKRWTKKVDLFSKWLLLFPIHLEIHWSLITVTMATKTISYYDSQGIVFRHTTDNIMKYLQSEAREKQQTAFQKGWKITIIKGIPQQKNDSDCGVFVLEYCRCLSVKQPLLFSQEDMPCIRKRIHKELCDCRLNI
ncbi:sentrin-specific protease 1 isoform X2 [Etheostoma spectabile]|uniref:sentrin-specific protease 1 isoform X2 n=1 Tax=Etheostoma spectabile TaxID=54343 RepID=UPI0013AF47E5|nr:sentrin-specific protease 1-like isoform X2 [Etheostoma spectabile]